jgi:hypothetical protein
MHSAREDYAVRAELARALAGVRPLKREQIGESEDIPVPFLQNTLMELGHAEVVEVQRAREESSGSPGPPRKSPSPTWAAPRAPRGKRSAASRRSALE